jgi:micrococcal nuclease
VALLPWWALRASVVEDYRKTGIPAGALSVRLDYQEIVQAAHDNRSITVLCDLQSGVNKWTGGGALVYAGSPQHKFNLWIPDAQSNSAILLLQLIERRYAGMGRGYVYVSGQAKLYNEKPEIVLTDIAQLSDFPPAGS